MLRPIIGPVRVNEIHSSGKGIAIWNEKKYYIPHALTNEDYMIKTENRRLGFRTAKIISIEKQSSSRRTPICPYFGLCGGCNFMHIEYNEQIAIKKTILQNAFIKYQIPFNIKTHVPAINTLNYRNKATFQVLYQNQQIKIGFHPEWAKNELIEIKSCFLLKPIINEYFDKIARSIRHYFYKTNDKQILSFTIRCNRQDHVMLIIEIQNHPTNELQQFFDEIKTILKTTDSFYFFIKPKEKKESPLAIHIENTSLYLFEKIHDINLRISPFTFFQNNIEITEEIIHFIKNSLNFTSVYNLFDLYSGNGTMSLPLIANKGIQLWGIEGNPSSIEDAKFNSQNNPLHHHILGDVLLTFTKTFLKNHPHPDVILLDPPRSGTLIEIQKNIIESSPAFIVYVSCNPISLAWNLSQLITHYTIKHTVIFDMFPQTHQFETVVILEKTKDFA